MVEQMTTAAHDRAKTWAIALLEEPPWSETRARAALLLTGPPSTPWLTSELAEAARPAAWLLVDRADVRGLPPAQREPLARDGVVVQDSPRGELVAIVVEALDLILAGTGRKAIEARWTAAHAEPLHDPLRRYETLQRAAGVLPRDGEERVLRPLFLQLVDALRGLSTGGHPAAGEVAAAAYRLASTIETGVHAPIEWLALDGDEMPLIVRLRSWLADLPGVGAGDVDALRRVLASSDGVLRTFAEPLKERLGAPAWLTGPTAYSLRAPR